MDNVQMISIQKKYHALAMMSLTRCTVDPPLPVIFAVFLTECPSLSLRIMSVCLAKNVLLSYPEPAGQPAIDAAACFSPITIWAWN
jgi:hypothetical protein